MNRLPGIDGREPCTNKVTLKDFSWTLYYWHEVINTARDIDKEIAYKEDYIKTMNELNDILNGAKMVPGLIGGIQDRSDLEKEAKARGLSIEEIMEEVAIKSAKISRRDGYAFSGLFGSFAAKQTLEQLLEGNRVNPDDIRRLQLVFKGKAIGLAIAQIDNNEEVEALGGAEVLQCILTSGKHITDLTKGLAFDILNEENRKNKCQ